MATNQTLVVSELFYSLQGESSYSGLPCVFIRLSGCNLRCGYCDAAYTYEEEGRLVNLDTIINFVDEYKNAIVEVTGGEPLLQENIYLLLKKLHEKGRKTLIETNGSVAIDRIPVDVCTIVDVKCPSSGFETSFEHANLLHIKKRMGLDCQSTEVKFVISDQNDYQWAKQFISKHDLASIVPILFSPVTSSIQAKELGELILIDQLNVRLQLQLHTLLWPDKKRGV